MTKITKVNIDGASMSIPNNSWGDGDIIAPTSGVNAIGDQKLKHLYQIAVPGFVAPANAITAITQYLGFVRVAGVVRDFQALVNGTIATGGDRTVNVDLQHSTGGGGYSTMLSATILFNNGSTLLVPGAASFASTALAAGDSLQIVTTVAGAAGNQAKGLAVAVWIAENPF